LRLCVVGGDTSHATEFTARLNDPGHAEHVAGARVVRLLPLASRDIALSRDRVGGFTAELVASYGVKVVTSWEEALRNVDGVLLLSLDGRVHLDQVRRAVPAGVPVFLDKPVAADLAEVREIFALAAAARVPLYSGSALRWHSELRALAGVGCVPVELTCLGPAPDLEHHPELFFYGIHCVEAVFTVMGENWQRVECSRTKTGKVVVAAQWENGCWVSMLLTKEHGVPYKLVRKDAGVERVALMDSGFYGPLLKEIVKFMVCGLPPVTAQQTLAIYEFMTAVNECLAAGEGASRLRGGAPEGTG
jgi:hypothetical protein